MLGNPQRLQVIPQRKPFGSVEKRAGMERNGQILFYFMDPIISNIQQAPAKQPPLPWLLRRVAKQTQTMDPVELVRSRWLHIEHGALFIAV